VAQNDAHAKEKQTEAPKDISKAKPRPLSPGALAHKKPMMSRSIIYTGLFVRNPAQLYRIFPPKHSKVVPSPHVTLDFKPGSAAVSKLRIGEVHFLKILCRVWDRSCDCLLVEGASASSKAFPHITLSLHGSTTPNYSNSLLEKAFTRPDTVGVEWPGEAVGCKMGSAEEGGLASCHTGCSAAGGCSCSSCGTVYIEAVEGFFDGRVQTGRTELILGEPAGGSSSGGIGGAAGVGLGSSDYDGGLSETHRLLQTLAAAHGRPKTTVGREGSTEKSKGDDDDEDEESAEDRKKKAEKKAKKRSKEKREEEKGRAGRKEDSGGDETDVGAAGAGAAAAGPSLAALLLCAKEEKRKRKEEKKKAKKEEKARTEAAASKGDDENDDDDDDDDDFFRRAAILKGWGGDDDDEEGER
jgi:hypothetical protein